MQKFILKYIISNFHKPVSLILGWIIGIFGFAVIDDFFEKIVLATQARFSIYALLLVGWVSYWLYYKYSVPRNKKGEMGLVLAIYAETSYEEIRMKKDFVRKIEKSIKTEEFGKVVNIIIVKNHICEKIKSFNDVQKLHKKIKGHFYLWGDVKRRSDGQKKYFLDLDGMVIHSPVNVQVKKDLFKDFISILPKQVSFLEAFEFKGFEFTADIVYLAIRYITGIAAYLSGDPKFAYNLHSGLQQEFNKFRPLPIHLQAIRNKIPLLLSSEELIIAQRCYKSNEEPELKEWLGKALTSNTNNYGGWLLQAIVDFLYDNDPKKALDSIKKARKYARGTHEWRYSRAFLYFWLEKYGDALKECKKISQKSYMGEENTIRQVENFNLELLEKYSDKSQLYFWLGYIQFIKEKNLPKAFKYFENFEASAKLSMQLLKQKSEGYLAQIRNEMSLKELK